ncbi:uncharacterized protein LOC133305032 [Gastrolobium bilobum]|uniref:uncharacterized protein LOC133305032 n=1 Tax=Gastrolobium bilobum TaxID=150636 RepID=UPI002AAFA61F|nr:uncharacterized protein LOC133305032 [Gastrolobium bilobum]
MAVTKEHKARWKKTGCIVMTGGWTDKRRRTIINSCVHSSKEVVLLKFIDASQITKTTDKILKMIDEVVKEVVKKTLSKMFNSDEWKTSQYAKSANGMLIENLVMDKVFWRNVDICLIRVTPLIEMLRLVDSDDEVMGSIYDTMDRAKEKIESEFKKKPSLWDNKLHRPLQAAGYYLNPKHHYSPTFKVDYEVKVGLYDCVKRMVGDLAVERKIDQQLEAFKDREGLLGISFARDGVDTKSPAAWSTHKKRNHLKHNTINDVVFVMANSRLGNRKHKISPQIECNFDDIDSDDYWIVEPTYEENLEDVEV